MRSEFGLEHQLVILNLDLNDARKRAGALELELGETRGMVDVLKALVRETERALLVAEQALVAAHECPPGINSYLGCPDHGDCVKCWDTHLRGGK